MIIVSNFCISAGPENFEVQDHLVKSSKFWGLKNFFLQIGGLFTYKNFQKFWGPKTNVSLGLVQGRPASNALIIYFMILINMFL